MSALVTTNRIMEAEFEYFQRYGQYAELPDLGPSGANLIPKSMAVGRSNGYEFRVQKLTAGFTVEARPIQLGKTGLRTLYADTTGIVRQNWGPEHATASSQLVR